ARCRSVPDRSSSRYELRLRVVFGPRCLLLVFGVTERAASPPLFPYTTLFRSPRVRGAVAHLGRAGLAGGGDAGHGQVAGGAAGEDRKSTRLNSSHVKISYAVFCLKKKNKKVRAGARWRPGGPAPRQ